MKREPWFREDIGQVLLAVSEASRSACRTVFAPRQDAGDRPSSAELMDAYQAGFQAALSSLALAFGLLDVAGSLPRDWVTVLEDEPEPAVWPQVLGIGDVAHSLGSSGNTEGGMSREWTEEDWR